MFGPTAVGGVAASGAPNPARRVRAASGTRASGTLARLAAGVIGVAAGVASGVVAADETCVRRLTTGR
jgi:hypothetical protein